MWPVLLLLLAAVVVPTACVLWFMNEAMRNERLAVRQKLADAYRLQLTGVVSRLDAPWKEKAEALSKAQAASAPAATFARLVTDGVCDGALIYDASGRLLYPANPESGAGASEQEPDEWRQASRTEYELSDPASAAAAYEKIAGQAGDVNATARALQAQARCLARAGQKEAALKILTVALADPKYRDARDTHGRFIVPSAQLFALDLIGDPQDPRYKSTLEDLVGRLNDYSDPVLPAAQRLFLMRQLKEAATTREDFPTLAAESLVAEYPAGSPSDLQPSVLLPTPLAGVWRMASPDRTIVALFREESFLGRMQSLVEPNAPAPDLTVRILPPTGAAPEQEPFLAIPAGERLPGWQLALYLAGPDPFATAAERQVAAYMWTGLLVIVAIGIIALVGGWYLLRQMRLTRLKNDFIAAVSHELKTPLSSMRVLVDTLLEGTYRDQQQAREYLQLVAKENERLSHLIDNFLTFSRMERNKKVFEFAEVEPAEVANAAAEVARSKFGSNGCRFDVNITPGLPTITADRDGIVTVLLNLLDNAYKYSEGDRHIELQAFEAGGRVCFEVRDNGIGLSGRAIRKIFDRFYQVDRTLSRNAGGCGLGLSIVKFIVDAHGGSIDVKSEPGKGSTFTVKLPASRRAAS
jgi:signal transduction histidine kinase